MHHERNFMSIKGFVGFWGNAGENMISKSLCDKYKLAIYNGVSFFSERYTVIVSDEYLVSQENDELMFKSGKEYLWSIDSMVTTVEISPSLLKIERDRWGTRMVYYVQDGENLYFASDMRFLLELPLENIKEYNRESLLESAALGYIYDDSGTLFNRIKQLPRNCRLEIKDGTCRIQKQLISADKQRFDSFEDAYLAFESIFEKNVADTCKIDRNRAYLLSGGMDSSAVAIAASKVGQIKTISFSSGNNVEDVYYAGKLAEHIGSEHTVLAFENDKAILEFPAFLHTIENMEMEGIFSPLGGFAYYLLCREIGKREYEVVFPGEGADEILGGYYWQLTHTFGFVDRLKENTLNTPVYDKIVSLFPEVEERNIYREIAYYVLQGSALTNYHLSCVEHIAKACSLFNYPVYMTGEIYDVVKDIPMKWLCDGQETKLILRRYLAKHLDGSGLSGLITRKKLAMPSVITDDFYQKLSYLAEKEAKVSNNPFCEVLGKKPLNIFMLDVFHKYYTLQPMESINSEMWQEDLVKTENGACIIHW